ncbi:MAG: hypothetical protein WBE72_00215 [Terracidiphilus sp.]
MHLNFHFSTAEVLWTLTFAALLVLLVVLLGRNRLSRFPWFTASIALVALRLLASRLLFNKMDPLTSTRIFLVLADLVAVVSLLVLVEMARRGFARASRTAWIAGTLVLVAAAGAVLAWWGPWPAWTTLTSGSTIANLKLMQLVEQKGDLLDSLLAVELCALVILFGRYFNAGWRSHVQQIVFGLSTVSIVQLALRAVFQKIANGPPPASQEEFTRITGLRDKLVNANSSVYLVVLLWWIVCLWIDEPWLKVNDAEPAAGAGAQQSPQN